MFLLKIKNSIHLKTTCLPAIISLITIITPLIASPPTNSFSFKNSISKNSISKNSTSNQNTILVAVSSNFVNPMNAIVKHFHKLHNYKVLLSFASTAKHYAQIIHGAPYHLFFAADSKHPKLLEQKGFAINKSRFTYAIGKIVLWSASNSIKFNNQDILSQKHKFQYLAIANPKLAPYGKAAYQVLVNLNLWHSLKNKCVFGENISQTFLYTKTNNAQLGFVALSQIKHYIQKLKYTKTSYWIVPQNLYHPIKQQAILIKNHPTAAAFINFFNNNNKVKAILKHFGYQLP